MHRVHGAAFRLGETRYRLADALLRSALAGEWRALEASIREGAACEERADAEGSPLGEGEIRDALREFRYDHDLIAAEEAEGWLDAWEITADEWREALVRQRLRRHWARHLDAIVRDFPPDEETLARIAWPDLVCSGAVERLARELAERAAVAGAIEADAGLPGDSAVSAAGRAVPGPLLPAWMGVPEDDATVRRLQRWEEGHAAARRREVTPDKVRAALASHALEWTYVEAVRLAFPAEPMAAEAALRVRVDGESLAEVAADLGRKAEAWRGFLEEAAPALRVRLIGASSGELLGPLADEDGHALLHVVTREAPRAEDARAWAHAEAHVWHGAAARALEAVVWELPDPKGVRG